MITLPRQNFARIILMMYILFCLIMRTAYQGKQFEFMIQEMRRPVVKTIDKLIEQNFTLYIRSSRMKYLAQMEFMHRLDKNVSTSSRENSSCEIFDLFLEQILMCIMLASKTT